MADNETTADVISAMRDEAARADMEQEYSIDDAAEMIREFAWRFEAAHKREVREAVTGSNQLREAVKRLDEILYIGTDGEVHGFLGKASEIESTIKDALATTATTEKSSAVGNAAKLREALKRVLCWLKRMNAQPLNTLAISELTPSHAVNRTAKSIIEDNDYHISQLTAALAAPPRNCDRFATLDEAREAHEAICDKYGVCRSGCPLNNEEHYSAFDCFEAWLFAPATEKEGGES